MNEDEPNQTPVRSRRARAAGAVNRHEGAATVETELKTPDVERPSKTRALALPVEGLPPDPAYVTIGAGFMENLGNYESLRIYASVTLPCDNTRSAIVKAKDRALALVEEFVEDERRAMLQTRS